MCLKFENRHCTNYMNVLLAISGSVYSIVYLQWDCHSLVRNGEVSAASCKFLDMSAMETTVSFYLFIY